MCVSDLPKAFDCVQHDNLMEKLRVLNIREKQKAS